MKFNNIFKVVVAIASAILLSACAAGPTKSQLESADYGRDITPEECITISENVISNGLKDPSSAQFKHGKCFKGYWNSVPIMGLGVAFGWVQQGEVNAKNSFGGYVGFSPYQVLINDGQVVRYCISDKDGLCIPNGK